MAIPNTTPTPNELYNGEMKKMGDTDLRVVLVVTRATLGWIIDEETGKRKEEDWISYYQLKKKTGRGYTALAKAVNNCIKRGWIEARNKDGNLLPNKNDRIGKRIYYRLGRIFLDRLTSSESEEVELTSSDSVITESVITESEAYKRNTIQNKNITKIKQAKACELQKLIELFKPINPSYQKLFPNTTQRKALQRLVDKFGYSEVQRLLEALPSIVVKKYAPRITTPLTLENKLGDLFIFMKQEKSNKSSMTII